MNNQGDLHFSILCHNNNCLSNIELNRTKNRIEQTKKPNSCQCQVKCQAYYQLRSQINPSLTPGSVTFLMTSLMVPIVPSMKPITI